VRLLACLLAPAFAVAADLPPGQLIPDVRCAADASQSYALYLPSNYAATRPWSVIFLFDPGARGSRGVERFQAAAEKYGYIVAGSNNSRNGPWEASITAALAMMNDAGMRLAIDPQRMYTAGLSGGARVAMKLAMDTGRFAGVIASSAGFPDFQPRKSVAFDVFGTAGTEDFNYIEMLEVDRTLTSPHRLAVFEGGHTWLPAGVAMEAVEWLEIRAMNAGRRARDQSFLDAILDQRTRKAEAEKDGYRSWLLWTAIHDDFATPLPAGLANRKDVKDGIKRARSDESREIRDRAELMQLVEGTSEEEPQVHVLRLNRLKQRLQSLSQQAKAPDDSPTRRMARRQLANASAAVRTFRDPEVRKIFDQAGGRF
jgi:poly(3-hydroxybutyrate) depolymerase